ncbi:alpha/beta hydrolase [Polynucleobacter sp. MG-5-Ahmo-C2]|uniref:alpha/beta hydrolase n=1 Tax=Polynucleobacter sp. MG-5-Ahmo-C2 TaxID=2081051 RepID=UPI001BFD4EE2|nr:alpha/beta fold hydrolase [Polynucleobacter sp. MG-5-Ahmo-C2]QWD99310.1 alpha/beta hydrolase [Polynucleobacter sp. MG-5-Ahmo-C2]
MPHRNEIGATSDSITILLPGLNGGGLELGQLPSFLSTNGFNTVVPEIKGYLYGSPADNYEEWLSQVHNCIDDHKLQYKTINLAGISMGATFALAIATQRSDISSIALYSPVLRYDGWSVPWYRFLLNIAYSLGIRNWEYSEREPFGIKNLELRRRIRDKFKSHELSEVGAPLITARHLYEANKLMAYTTKNLNLINSRLLLIQSVEDDTCSVWSAEKILSKVKSDLRRTIWLGNSYHIVTIDNEREIVLNETLRFLARVKGGNLGIDNYYLDMSPKALRTRTL